MKNIILVLLPVLFFSCNDGKNDKPPGADTTSNKTITTPQQTDSKAWIKSFREFRDAVFQNDRNKVKQFIDFPIMNYGNEIWYLVLEGSGKALKMLPEEIKPFTEKDFDKYFVKIFSKRFITSILKVKSEELFVKEESDTPDFEEDSTTYRMSAHFDKAENKLSLSINSMTPIEENDGTEDIITMSEYSIIYQFDVLADGKIKFRQVRMAG